MSPNLALSSIALPTGIYNSSRQMFLIFVLILCLWSPKHSNADPVEIEDTPIAHPTLQTTPPASTTTPNMIDLTTQQPFTTAFDNKTKNTPASSSSDLPRNWVTVQDRVGPELRKYDGQKTFQGSFLDKLSGEILSADGNSIYRLSGSLKLLDQLLVHPQKDCFSNACKKYNSISDADSLLFYHIPKLDVVMYCEREMRDNCSLIQIRPLERLSVLSDAVSSFFSGSSSHSMVEVFSNSLNKSATADTSLKIFTAKSFTGLLSVQYSDQPSISFRTFVPKHINNATLFDFLHGRSDYGLDRLRKVESGVPDVHNKSLKHYLLSEEKPTKDSEKISKAADKKLDESHSVPTSTGEVESIRNGTSPEIPAASADDNFFLNFSRAAAESNYTIEYVYGFESGHYVYWITVQRDSLRPTDNYDTRLVRVCKDGGSGFKSYSELSLTCRKKTSLGTFYNIALAGYFGKAEADISRRFGLREAERKDVLYIVMGRSKQGQKNAEEEFGFGICMYLIRDIERTFSRTERDCYMGHGKTVAWLNNGSKECKKNERLAEATSSETGFCAAAGSQAAARLNEGQLQPLFPGISSRYPLNTDTNYTSENHLGTSMIIEGQSGNTVAFIGTNNGHLIKILLNGFNLPPLLDLDLTQGLDQSYSVRQIYPDLSTRYLYAISGPRITRIPIRSCSLYTDCSSCLQSSDPMECGWCVNRCSTQQHCPASSSWSNNTCSPVIYSFTPYAGPVQGGTRLTVVGQNFGLESSAERPNMFTTTPSIISQAYVKVGDVECYIESITSTNVTCVTGESAGRVLSREITISLSESKSSKSSGPAIYDGKVRGYKIHGTATTGAIGYMYKVARVTSFAPLVGSRSGGTIMTIYGGNLDIGSMLNVSVASQPCQVLSATKDTVICRTSLLPDDSALPSIIPPPRFEPLRQDISSNEQVLTKPESQTKNNFTEATASRSQQEDKKEMRSDSQHLDSLMFGPVVVTIDDAILSVPHLQFHYRADPTFGEIFSSGSILSGGMKATIKGFNLHTMQKPLLQVWTNFDDNPFTTICQSNPNGSIMTCITPNLALTLANVTSERPLTTRAVLVINPGDGRPPTTHISIDGERSSSFSTTSTVEPVNFDLKYYVDPVIEPFIAEGLSEELKAVRRFYLNENYLDIKGQNLDLVATSSDYRVTIGGSECRVTQLMRHSLICQPSKSSGVSLIGTEHDVLVRIGNLEILVGRLIYTERQSNWLITWMIVPIMCLLCIVTLLFLFWIRKSCHCMKRWKSEGKEGLAVSYIHVPDHTRALRGYFSNGPLPSANIINNAYWLNWQPSNNDQSMTQPHESIVNADSWQQVYDSNIFISREDIVLLDKIGQGHFGCVYRGVLLSEESLDRQVAIKTLKGLQDGYGESGCGHGASPGEVKKFLEEALTMREFDHAHVLSLIGVSMDKDRLPLVVLPYLKHGDLLSYIRNENNSPTVKELMMFGIQIAEGMVYLSSLKFVHRDLAARNCMLDDDMKVKVADFGLSRDVYERDYYSSDNRRSKLPVKWMAPESLEMGIYSSKTDVWSYGVVVWELMTRGVCPYPEVDNWDIVKFLSSGRRMAQPMYCPDPLYEIMLRCWHPDIKARPGFDELAKKIRQIIASMENSSTLFNFKAHGISASLENFAECRYNKGVVQYSNVIRTSASTDCLSRSESVDATTEASEVSLLNSSLVAVTTTV